MTNPRITVVPSEEGASRSGIYRHVLAIDGVVTQVLVGGVDHRPSGPWTLSVPADNGCLDGFTLVDLASDVSDLTFAKRPRLHEWIDQRMLVLFEGQWSETLVSSDLNMPYESWTFPFSVTEFLDELRLLLPPVTLIENPDQTPSAYSLQRVLAPAGPDGSIRLGQLYGESFGAAALAIDRAVLDLSDRTGGVVLREFSFPVEYRVACQQYLLYFAQFLSDLGIDQRVAFEETRDHFFVKALPGSSRAAITTIRDMLAAYCQLAESGDAISSLQQSSDPGAQQLLSQVHFLHGQVAVFRAQLEAKNATIDAQRAEIEIYRGGSASAPSDSERLFGNLISVEQAVIKEGIKINLPEIVRRLKRLKK